MENLKLLAIMELVNTKTQYHLEAVNKRKGKGVVGGLYWLMGNRLGEL